MYSNLKRSLVLAGLGLASYRAYRALKPQYGFRQKHIMITGGSRGLGLVLARKLAEIGARISICSRDREELVRAEVDLKTHGTIVYAAICDARDRMQVKEFFKSARFQNGPIDVLINNAGVIQVGPAEEMTSEDFDNSLKTHFWAAYNTTQEVLPEMKARRSGRIVNISSIGGKISLPHLLPYSVGKFALVAYSDGLRAESARHGVVVTTVCPGLMRTGSHVNAHFKGRNEEEYAWFAIGDTMPFVSMSAESAAQSILNACARGDAQAVLGLPTRMAAAAHALAPNLSADVLAWINRIVLPETGGISQATATGLESRGKLPAVVTTLIDQASVRNNE